MSIMTIISCKILQDEIIHLLENDSSVDEAIVVRSGEEEEFLKKMDFLGLKYKHISIDELEKVSERKDADKFIVQIYFMELALHEFPKNLQSGLYDMIHKLTEYSNGILLFYGLCGNVLRNVEKDFASQEEQCPVRILKEGERIVDDCIGATLGGSDAYLRTLKKFSDRGTFFFTPMYASSWREIMRVDPKGGQTIDMLKEMNELTGYGRVAKVRTGLRYTSDFDETVDEFARIFGFEVLEIEGNQNIFRDSYNSMKERMGIK